MQLGHKNLHPEDSVVMSQNDVRAATLGYSTSAIPTPGANPSNAPLSPTYHEGLVTPGPQQTPWTPLLDPQQDWLNKSPTHEDRENARISAEEFNRMANVPIIANQDALGLQVLGDAAVRPEHHNSPYHDPPRSRNPSPELAPQLSGLENQQRRQYRQKPTPGLFTAPMQEAE